MTEPARVGGLDPDLGADGKPLKPSVNAEQHSHVREQLVAAAKQEVADWDGTDGAWIWLSFCDPDKPAGQQFLGVSIVKAPSLLAASVVASMIADCNPGGEVQMVTIPSEFESLIHPAWTGRLLTKSDAKELDRLMSEHIASGPRHRSHEN